MRLTRAIAVLTVALLLLTLEALPALAAPPSNDTIGGATVASLGFNETLVTTEATTDADDYALNLGCGAPATDASVWYSYTPATDGGVVVDVRGSDYSAGVLVGYSSSLFGVTCGAGTAAFNAVAGTTYYILAIDYQGDGGGNGGTLRISINAAPPVPTVDITADPFGQVNPKTGVASLSGTYTCSNADYIHLIGYARQVLPRFVVEGSFEFYGDVGTCDGTAHPWSGTVVPYAGKFAGGKAMTLTFAYSCSDFLCSDTFAEQTVILRGGKL